MHIIAVDTVEPEKEEKPVVKTWRYTPFTLKLYRRLRRAMFPGRRLDRMAKGAREALERCEQIGTCKID